MSGKLIGLIILIGSLIGGIALYYLQVYGFYEPVVEAEVQLVSVVSDMPEPISFDNFEAIDAESSPIRYRACFTTDMSLALLTETYVGLADATPRNAPHWFDCFDAAQIGADLRTEAIAFMGVENIEYGIDRIVAVYPDGRGYAWHQINACGEVVFDGNRPPDDCPPLPESTE